MAELMIGTEAKKIRKKNIRSQYPVKIAFGMADAGSIEKG
jgi:hypothetical protein